MTVLLLLVVFNVCYHCCLLLLCCCCCCSSSSSSSNSSSSSSTTTSRCRSPWTATKCGRHHPDQLQKITPKFGRDLLRVLFDNLRIYNKTHMFLHVFLWNICVFRVSCCLYFWTPHRKSRAISCMTRAVHAIQELSTFDKSFRPLTEVFRSNTSAFNLRRSVDQDKSFNRDKSFDRDKSYQQVLSI